MGRKRKNGAEEGREEQDRSPIQLTSPGCGRDLKFDRPQQVETSSVAQADCGLAGIFPERGEGVLGK
jgi:hypothetical protein